MSRVQISRDAYEKDILVETSDDVLSPLFDEGTEMSVSSHTLRHPMIWSGTHKKRRKECTIHESKNAQYTNGLAVARQLWQLRATSAVLVVDSGDVLLYSNRLRVAFDIFGHKRPLHSARGLTDSHLCAASHVLSKNHLIYISYMKHDSFIYLTYIRVFRQNPAATHPKKAGG